MRAAGRACAAPAERGSAAPTPAAVESRSSCRRFSVERSPRVASDMQSPRVGDEALASRDREQVLGQRGCDDRHVSACREYTVGGQSARGKIAPGRHRHSRRSPRRRPRKCVRRTRSCAIIRVAQALDLSCGMVFAHVGCGLGYYTALAAAVVGASGRVLAIDIDAELAARAARNLSGLQQVRVVSGDGTSVELPPCDAVLVNAGLTHPLPRWLNALREGGRLLLPITAQVPGSPTALGQWSS